MAASINALLDQFRTWLDSVKEAFVDGKGRKWCLLGMTDPITQQTAAKTFDRKDLNKQYVERYIVTDPSKRRACAHLQLEITAIQSLHKSFVSRHKTRLQYYADDISNKTVRTKASVTIAEAAMDNFTKKITT